MLKFVDWLFGFDFFISYSHSDGKNYPRELRENLIRLGFSVFLDQTDYTPGIDLRRETRRYVKKSTKVVVVGRPAALRSKWVKAEVDTSLRFGKTPIIIDVNNSINGAPLTAPVARLALQSDWLHIREQVGSHDDLPTETTINELARSFRYVRQEVKRLRVVSLAAVVLGCISVIAAWQAYEARQQRNTAELNLAALTENIGGVLVDLVDSLNSAAVKSESVLKVLDATRRAHDRVVKVSGNDLRARSGEVALDVQYGIYYTRMHQFDKAEQKFTMACEIADRLGKDHSEIFVFDYQRAACLFHLGKLRSVTGRFKDARAAYGKANSIIAKRLILNSTFTGFHALQFDILLNLAELERQIFNSPSDSLQHLNDAVVTARAWLKLGRYSDSRRAFVSVAMAHIHQNGKRTDKQLIEDALTVLEELEMESDVPQEWIGLREKLVQLRN